MSVYIQLVSRLKLALSWFAFRGGSAGKEQDTLPTFPYLYNVISVMLSLCLFFFFFFYSLFLTLFALSFLDPNPSFDLSFFLPFY